MKLFNEDRLWDVLEGQTRKLKVEMESQDRNYLLNANETQLIRYFTDKYQIDPLELHTDKIYVSDREEMTQCCKGLSGGFGFVFFGCFRVIKQYSVDRIVTGASDGSLSFLLHGLASLRWCFSPSFMPCIAKKFI